MALRLLRLAVLLVLPAALALANADAARGQDPAADTPAPAATAPAAPTPPAPALLGRVTDAETGRPIENANVYAQGSKAGTVSTLDGLFSLRGAPDEPYTLVITFLGYEPRLLRIDPAAPAAEVLAVALTPTVYAGEEIVITASRYGSDVHLSQTNLSQEAIRESADERDLPLLLEAVPGVHASSDAGGGVGYTYLNIRGFDQRRVGVMINGIPLNDPEDHQVYWVDMPGLAESLEDVQVQRGITNSLGGMTAIGGTVNLVTDVLGPQAEGRLTLQAGSYGTARQSLAWQSGLLDGRFATALRISHLESDGYRQRSGSDQWGVFWAGRYVYPSGELQANVYTGRELTQHAWDGIDLATLARDRTANPETYHNAVDDFRQPHYELHWRWNLSDRVMLRSAAFLIHGEGYYENFKADRRAGDFSLDRYLGLGPDEERDLVRRKWVRKDQTGLVPQLLVEHRGGRLAAGGDWYTFHSNHWGDVLWVEGFATAATTDGLKYADYEGDKTAWSAYLNERWAPVPGLTLLLDLQYQRKVYEFRQNEVGNFTSVPVEDAGLVPRNAYRVVHRWFNPKGGLHWRTPARPLGGELGLYAHVGMARREPADADHFDAFQDAYDLGAQPLFRRWRDVLSADGTRIERREWSDPIVQEERVVNWETGLSWRGEDVSLTINGYWMDFDHEIVPSGAFDPERMSAVRGNAGRTWHRGIEAGLTARLGGRHALTAAVSRSWDEFRDYAHLENVYDPETWEVVGVEARDYAGNPIALFPNWLASATLRSAWGGWTTTVRARGAGRQHLDNTGIRARTIDGYATLDLGVAADLGRLLSGALAGASAELRVRNVLDTEYETSGYFVDPAWGGAGNTVIPAATRNWLLGVQYRF